MTAGRYDWLPPEVELMAETSEADWVVAALRPWDEDGVRVGSFMPDVYDSYARVDRGRDAADGTDRGMLGDLVAVLSKSTTPSDRCWFCLWEGWGTWWKGAHGTLYTRSRPRLSRRERKELREARRLEWRIDEERDGVLRRTPRVRTEHRAYLLARGPLSAAVPLSEAAGDGAPNLWWPADRSWLVSTEVDGDATYVGGSTELVDALLAASELVASETSVSARLA